MEIAIQLTKQGRQVLDVQCQLPIKQNIIGLYGPSGSGKTSLLRCIAGLEKDMHGSIDCEAEPVGLVFQEAALFPHLSVLENLQFALKLAKPVRFDIEQVSHWFELEKLLPRHIGDLSGGEQQRVALARALLNNPQLLLLDEPVSALDETTRYQVLDRLNQINHDFALPMIMVSHSLHELARCCDYMLHIQQGQIIAQGQGHEVIRQINLAGKKRAFSVLQCRFNQYVDDYAIAELDCEGQRLFIPHSAINRPNESVMIEANQVSLSIQTPSTSSIINSLHGIVSQICQLDESLVRVEVKVGQQSLLADISAWSAHRLSLVENMPVWAQFKMTR